MNTEVTLYISYDNYAASCLNDNDLDSFIEYLKDEDFFTYDEMTFKSQEDASTFCEGLFYGEDERAPLSKMVLWSNVENHQEWIDVLHKYDEGTLNEEDEDDF